MLDYKDIIIKHYALGMSGLEIARQLGCSVSGVNDFLRAFRGSEKLSYPLPEGITNYGICELVYGHAPGYNTRHPSYEQPDFERVYRQMSERKNMTLVYLWNRYKRQCEDSGSKPYQYRQFCELYARWVEDNYESLHIQAVAGQKMEVDFAGKTFPLIDKITGEITDIVVFVAILPYSQYMERKTAKVSGDFHVRFDSAYYSVDKSLLHKSVIIGATVDTVNIYRMDGTLVCSWPRAKRKGEWLTDPKHLPDSYKDMSEWNASYFTRKAMTVGPNTVKVIEAILKSRPLEVQTYRLCMGVLNFTKKYSKLTLEDCCRSAVETNHMTYSFIKNSIAAVAEEIGSAGYNTKLNDERNRGAFIMDPHAGDIDALLSRSRKLAGKEDSHEE